MVDLLFMLFLKDPQEHASLCIPNLRRIGKQCMSILGSHWSPLVFVGRDVSYLDFSVTGAGCKQTVVRGEGAAEHLVVMCLDLCQLLTCGAFKHLRT